MKSIVNSIIRILFLTTLVSISSFAQEIQIKLSENTLAGIDDRLFGQFMEKCSWADEIGGDLFLDSTTKKPFPIALELLKSMQVPMIRFPGGTDWDYHSWLELIDNAPGGSKKRSPYYTRNGNKVISDNRLGLNEFLLLCESNHIEPIYVLNIGDAFFRKISIDSSVRSALALYEYCNGTTPGLPSLSKKSWADIRAKNGRRKPFKVKYFEIGNEPWMFSEQMTMDKSNPDTLQHYLNCITTVAVALKKRDPEVKIIMDVTFKGFMNRMEIFKQYADYLVFHSYAPWEISYYQLNDNDKIKPSKMEPEDIWKAWVTTPFIDTTTGFTSYDSEWIVSMLASSGLPIAVTEWNWNGWHTDDSSYEKDVAKGIGAAGYLHAFMRKGDLFKIGCQSILIGKNWGITSIRVNKKKFSDMYLMPTGAVSGLYSSLHGAYLTKNEVQNMEFYSQPYKVHAINPSPKVAMLDIVSSKNSASHILHIISRSFKKETSITINASELKCKNKIKITELVPNEEQSQFIRQEKSMEVINLSEISLSIKPQSITFISFTY